MRKYLFITVSVVIALCLAGPQRSLAGPQRSGKAMRIVSVKEIYAKGKHNAWPDMCRWNGKYYVAFAAHGQGHAELHDVVIMSSTDGDKWETILDIDPNKEWRLRDDETHSAIEFDFLPTQERLYILFWNRRSGDDLLEVSPEKKAALKKEWLELGGSEKSFSRWVACHEESYRTGITYTEDGRTWAKPRPMLPDGWWTWRPHTLKGRHYVIALHNHAQQWTFSPELKTMIRLADTIELFGSISMFTSDDGLKWTKLVDIAAEDNDETDFNFGPQGRILAVSRNGAAMKHAIAYVSDPPYSQWKTLRLDQMIHQPVVLYHKGRWIVGGRGLDESSKVPARFAPATSFDGYCPARLWFLDDKTGQLTEGTTLPSWGDCGEPSILPTPEGDLLVAYYSCSKRIADTKLMGPGPLPGKYTACSIYLARVVIE